MAGSCIEKLPHSCGSSDGLQVFEEDGKYTGYCFSCSQYVPHPYGEDREAKQAPKKRVAKSPEDIQKELDEISAYQSRSIPSRRLGTEAINYFGCKTGLSEQDGETIVTQHFPYFKQGKLVGYRNKLLDPKQFWITGNLDGCDLFGWDQAVKSGAKRLIITEGENDAIALWQVLKDKNRNTPYEKYDPAVVSLTNGSGSARKNISDNMSKIRHHFKEVVLAFDDDEAGKTATSSAMLVFPTAMTAKLPAKDPNQALIDGRSVALANAVLFKAEIPKNTRLVSATDLYTQAAEPPKPGLSWPWDGLTKLTKGLRFGEVTYIGAGVKQGKSEIVNTLAAHYMVKHGLKCFLVKPEESNVKTIKMVLGKVAATHFHDPDVPFDRAAYDEAANIVGDKLFLLNLYQHLGWDSLRTDIQVAAAQGCKIVFIDPITNLTGGVGSGEANTLLQDIAHELAALARDLNLHVFVFCHLKSPESGDPHERGGKVLSSQFAGSRAMMRSAQLMIGLEGNRDPDLDPEQRNMRKLVILEDREFGNVGIINLYWDARTGLFVEVPK